LHQSVGQSVSQSLPGVYSEIHINYKFSGHVTTDTVTGGMIFSPKGNWERKSEIVRAHSIMYIILRPKSPFVHSTHVG